MLAACALLLAEISQRCYTGAAMTAKTAAPQFNVRSHVARDLATELARRTGMTRTQVVEEALRAYTPPPSGPVPAGLVQSGPLLVAAADGRTVTLEQANAALDEIRSERGL